ncbi:ANK_REP_REGION domain-containing protein [Psidium guajava]|nr:ANK_REP_REGION domain-containing protein [Psidium guajava]
MASITCFLLLLAFASLAKAQETRSNVTLGASLSPTANSSSWLSPSGLYAFGFYPQGQGYAVGVFLVGILPRTVIWTANRDDPPVSAGATLLFTNDGRLILRSSQGQETSITSASLSAYSASMLDSGNFALYDPKGSVLWQSFDSPTDTLLPTQRLLAGQQIISSISATNHSTGLFRLKMQNDGNLIQYPVNTPDTAPYSYFTSWTGKAGDNVSLNFNVDGHMFLLNTTGYIIWNITPRGLPTKSTIFIFRIDTDGLMRMYSYDLNQKGNWSVVWQSTNDECDPKGLCGLNGFCVKNDQQANCQCLPGFDFVEPGNWAAGCERNFTADTCKTGDSSASYIIQPVDNTLWEDDSYSVVSSTDKDGCKQSCLEDCNCEAALYNGGNCRKQRLPLRYGRILLSDPTSALIKVGMTKPVFADQNKKEMTRRDVLFVSLSLLALGFIMMAISVVIICKNSVWTYKRIRNKIEAGLAKDSAPRPFTYAELELVTDGFKEQIGRGAFGTVYKGVIGEKEVAVKRLDKYLAEGEREFQTEVEVIGRTHHRNLVRLLGYCLEGTNRLLVYEYMSNGSLANVLFDSSESRPSWDERMDIARDIARGVLYLHEECETQIIHCDIKPQNILMDKNRAKISDFGLAKLLNADQTRTFTGIRGTRGYVAPEWHQNKPVTVKADVYSFGIVLLEIICGRRKVDVDLPESEAILEDWVCECFWNGKIGKLTGDEKVDEDELKAAIKVALWCISDDPTLRPAMKRVLLMLEGSAEIPTPPIPSSSICTDKSFV